MQCSFQRHFNLSENNGTMSSTVFIHNFFVHTVWLKPTIGLQLASSSTMRMKLGNELTKNETKYKI